MFSHVSNPGGLKNTLLSRCIFENNCGYEKSGQEIPRTELEVRRLWLHESRL